LRAQPYSAEAEHYLGRIELQRGQIEASRQRFARAARLEPENGTYRMYLGWAALESNEMTPALRDLEAAIKECNGFPDELFRWAKADYYAMIENTDTEIGRLLDALDELGIADDTLIVFTTDHGEHCGDHRLMYKGSQIFDGLMHVPLLYSWPGHLQGRRTLAVVEEVDIYPTVLSLLGIEMTPGVQGTDRSDLLAGEFDSGRERVLCELDHVTPKHRAAYALRTREWKLIYYPDVQTGMLFDLAADPDELTNRFLDPACVEVRQRMMSELVDEINAQKDPLPIRVSKA